MAEEEKRPQGSILKKLKIRDTKSRKDRTFRKEVNEKSETLPSHSKVAVIQSKEFEMVATCMQNMEPELEQELQNLGAKDIRVGKRAIKFKGDLKLLYECNIWLRTALKVLKPLYYFNAKNDEALYQKAMKIAWEEIFTSDKTFSIDAAVSSKHFTHSQYISLKLKDAIVDRFRAQQLKRPNVERYDPDVKIHLHINDESVSISLDSSGDPLFKRGYRAKQHAAPINECLAAGLILKSGWKGDVDFLDPMTGSGTIAIEASLIACNIPPNLNRTHFAFEGWSSYDPSLLSEVLRESRDKYKALKVNIWAKEVNSNNLRLARMNINAANMRKSIELEQADFFKAKKPSDKGVILMNPPYGERLEIIEGLPNFFERVGSALKHEYAGWSAWIISSDIESFKSVGLKPTAKIPVMNGKLACQFRKYELFEGKRDEEVRKRKNR